MSRPPTKPKVGFDWRTEGRETIAVCRLCFAHFYGRTRSAIYPSTSVHKDTCPKIAEWVVEMKSRGLSY